MKPRNLLDESTTPDGATMSLHEHDDAVILDVDNGPTGMVKATNTSLYSHKGLRTVRKLLKPRGRAGFWSAGEDPHFKARMETVGFRVGHIRAKVHAGSKRAAYVIYVADE